MKPPDCPLASVPVCLTYTRSGRRLYAFADARPWVTVGEFRRHCSVPQYRRLAQELFRSELSRALAGVDMKEAAGG